MCIKSMMFVKLPPVQDITDAQFNDLVADGSSLASDARGVRGRRGAARRRGALGLRCYSRFTIGSVIWKSGAVESCSSI